MNNPTFRRVIINFIFLMSCTAAFSGNKQKSLEVSVKSRHAQQGDEIMIGIIITESHNRNYRLLFILVAKIQNKNAFR